MSAGEDWVQNEVEGLTFVRSKDTLSIERKEATSMEFTGEEIRKLMCGGIYFINEI